MVSEKSVFVCGVGVGWGEGGGAMNRYSCTLAKTNADGITCTDDNESLILRMKITSVCH